MPRKTRLTVKPNKAKTPKPVYNLTHKTHLDNLPLDVRYKIYDYANTEIKQLVRENLNWTGRPGLDMFYYDEDLIRKKLKIKNYDKPKLVSEKISKFRDEYMSPIINYYFTLEDNFVNVFKSDYIGINIPNLHTSSFEYYNRRFNRSYVDHYLNPIYDIIPKMNNLLNKLKKKFNSGLLKEYIDVINNNINKINNTINVNGKNKISLLKSQKSKSSSLRNKLKISSRSTQKAKSI